MCIKGLKAGAKGRLKEILAKGGLTIEFYRVRDKTSARRPLVNIYRSDGSEVEQTR
jgi:hypothetical protein